MGELIPQSSQQRWGIRGRPGAMPYAAHLLTHRFSDVAGPGLEKLAAHSDPWVSEKARAILLDIHRAGVPKLWIKTLNGFEVLRGGAAMTEADWQRKRAQTLLKAIIARGGKKVPKDVVIEEDWAAEKRSKLRMLYLDTLLTLAPICTDQGAWKKAERCYLKAIDSDSLLEEAYRGLMILYDRQGMHSHAVRVYETCKFKLREALQVPPPRKQWQSTKKLWKTCPVNNPNPSLPTSIVGPWLPFGNPLQI
ncbi:conserved hypothetical protein [delta proteobacterium NaphS2]|nr:conserved hypothetical protein [delta proteobacterium NaphS2]